MAGSRKSVTYVADSGASFSILVDESNIELIMGEQVPASAAYPALPKGTTPRFVRVESELGLTKRIIPVLSLARYTTLSGATPLTLGLGDVDNGTAVRVRTKVGERNRFIPRDYDTGKLDGDST